MFSCEIAPRFSETDALGHVSNTVMPVWFEVGREALFRLVHPPLTLRNWPLIVARVEIDYRQQVRIGSPVTVETGVCHIGTRAFTAYQQAWQSRTLAACGQTVLVYYDYQKQSTQPLPEPIKRALRDHWLEADSGESG